MHFAVIAIWGISLASIFCMLVRPKGIAEAWWVSGGALLLVGTRLLSPGAAGGAVWKGLDVYLFLTGMMVLSELARAEGVFDWVAGIAARRARGSPTRLFLLIYLTGTVVTTLLSNDATAVVLTPAVLAVVRKAGVKPKPYLLACALIANAASFVLPISNPANLVIFAKHMPVLGKWLGTFLVPSAGSILVTLAMLWLLSREELKGEAKDGGVAMKLSGGGKLAVAGLLLACAALLASSAMGLDLGAPTCLAAVVAMLLVAYRDHGAPLRVVKGVSWGVLPLVAGLFVIVDALEPTGLLGVASSGLQMLAHGPRVLGNLVAGFTVGLLSNAMNNLPMGLISGAALQAASHGARLPESLRSAVLIGVDLGPNLSVTGSLATILWLIALRREKVEISGWEFLKAGMVAMPLALVVALLLLSV